MSRSASLHYAAGWRLRVWLTPPKPKLFQERAGFARARSREAGTPKSATKSSWLGAAEPDFVAFTTEGT
jgi:hypothetical protein